ncbi:MAG: TPM domain-containing protein [Lachnospiraceae bacterium]|nr:TPM domain-containing protein [Lachnospiraceae bacterium]
MAREKHYNSADRREHKILLGFIITAVVLLLIWIALTAIRYGFEEPATERTNPQQAGTPRVYDYADMLTDEQENRLEDAIVSAEQQILGDIVIVIENESFEKMYGVHYDSEDESTAYNCIKDYAQRFWDENGFGWNAPGDTGNGIILVDNVYRESNGYVYTWTAGSGDMRHKVGNSSCEKLTQDFINRLPSTVGYDDLYLQYSDTYADALMAFVNDCASFGELLKGTSGWAAFSPEGIAAGIGSNLIFVGILVLILIGLFVARQFAIRAADPDAVKSGKKRSRKSLGKGIEQVVIYVIMVVAILMGLMTDQTWMIMLAIIGTGLYKTFSRNRNRNKPANGAPVMGADGRPVAGQDGKPATDASPDQEKPGEGRAGKNKQRGFSVKEDLRPEDFRFTVRNDLFVRTYTTAVTHSSGSGGGGGGGGGHSGGGGHR